MQVYELKIVTSSWFLLRSGWRLWSSVSNHFFAADEYSGLLMSWRRDTFSYTQKWLNGKWKYSYGENFGMALQTNAVRITITISSWLLVILLSTGLWYSKKFGFVWVYTPSKYWIALVNDVKSANGLKWLKRSFSNADVQIVFERRLIRNKIMQLHAHLNLLNVFW